MNIDKQYTNVDKLTADLMNIPHRHTLSHFTTVAEYKAYKEGHCDARHAAVEVVLEHAQQDATPVAEWVNQEQGFQYLVEPYLPDGTKLYTHAVAPSDANGKADAANADGLQKVVDEYALARWVQGGNWPEKWKNILAAIATTSAADAKDAERWRKALLHVGGCYCSEGVRFTLRGLAPIKDANIMKGSVAQHFTEAIDAAIAVQQAQSSAMGGDAVGGANE